MSTTNTGDLDTPAAYAAGLRALADLIEASPDLPAPYAIRGMWIAYDAEDSRAMMREFARTVPGPISKVVDDSQYVLRANLGPISLSAIAWRSDVCERVVVGTEDVVVPAVEAQPERVETREVVEWRCHPILADEHEPVTA